MTFHLTQHGTKVADALVATSAAAATISWLEQINLIVSIIAGVVAIVAGCAAAYYHIKRSLD